MKKYLVCLLILISIDSYCQKNPTSSPKIKLSDRLYTGGNVGMQIGTVTFVDCSPLLGYKLTERLSMGLGATYQYYSYKDKYSSFSTSVYGGRIFSRVLITENIFVHGEYEVLNLQGYDITGYLSPDRVNVESLLLGGGYREEVGDKLFLNIMVLYNFTESPYTPYSNPIIRAGIDIGL